MSEAQGQPERWPCTPYCSPIRPCARECTAPPTPPPAVESETAEALLDLSVQLQGALGDQCHGRLANPEGGGIRCRRVVGHPRDRGLCADVDPELHAYGRFQHAPDELRTWSDDDMGATSHREWWTLYGEGELRRQRIREGRA